MSLFKRPDSPYWWLFLETTKQRERTDILVGTTPQLRQASRLLANDRYHQRMNELAARLYKLPSAMPAIRFARYAEPYATDVIALRRGARRELEILKHLVKDFGREFLTAIDQDRVRAYVRRRREAVAAVTVNREVALLKMMLRDAVPKYLSASPLVGMKRLPIVKPRRRLLSPDEEQKLLAVGDANDRAILIVGIDTMLRLGDLLDLERTDRNDVWLYVRDPKSGNPYEVALSKRAVAALEAIPGEHRYYFAKFRKAENPRDWPGAVRKRLRGLCQKAGLPYGRTANGITFHWATRRTGATRMLVENRVPLPVVQRQGNWKNPDVLLEIYAEAQRPDLLRAVGQLPDHPEGLGIGQIGGAS